MVSRVKLHNMSQNKNGPIRNFAARFRGQSSVCYFTIKSPGCNHHVNYSNQVSRDNIARGIGHQEIQLELLGEQNQDMSLD